MLALDDIKSYLHPDSQLEMTIRSLSEIHTNLQLIKQLGIKHLNLTDKAHKPNSLNNQNSPKKLENLELITKIREINNFIPDFRITATFSLKNHYFKGNKDSIKEDLDRYLQNKHQNIQIDELLIVSGNPKRALTSLDLLSWISESGTNTFTPPKLPISVAYNLDLPEKEQQEEDKRLIQKLQYREVSKVYLQISLNQKSLFKAIRTIENIRSDVLIIPAVILPSVNFLHQFRFRPWKGVSLTTDYLSSLKVAEKQTIEILRYWFSDNRPVLLTFT